MAFSNVVFCELDGDMADVSEVVMHDTASSLLDICSPAESLVMISSCPPSEPAIDPSLRVVGAAASLVGPISMIELSWSGLRSSMTGLGVIGLGGIGLGATRLGEVLEGPSHTPSASHRTRRSGGDICMLGQNTSNRLLSGIFVILCLFAVSLTRSETVRSTSRFSRGRRAINVASASRNDCDGGRIPANVGIASVESEGGFLRGIGAPDFGPEGSPMPGARVSFGSCASSELRVLLSAVIAASKYGASSCVRMGSGTATENV